MRLGRPDGEREEFVDDLECDRFAALSVLEGGELIRRAKTSGAPPVRDRVISTSMKRYRQARRFKGHQAQLSVDPDADLIDEVVVT